MSVSENGVHLKYLTISLCRLLSFFTDPLLVLIEYVPFGDLLGYLRKSRGLNDTYFKDSDAKPQTSLTAQQLVRFAWQVADGMSYLSSKKVRLKLGSETVTISEKLLLLVIGFKVHED